MRLGTWGQRWGEVMRGELKAATWGQERADRASCWGGGFRSASGGEDHPAQPLAPGVSPWLTVPCPCPIPHRNLHHHQSRAPSPLAVIRVLCQVNAGFCAQMGSRKDVLSVIKEAGSQPYEGSHKPLITLAASTGNATSGCP